MYDIDYAHYTNLCEITTRLKIHISVQLWKSKEDKLGDRGWTKYN